MRLRKWVANYFLRKAVEVQQGVEKNQQEWQRLRATVCRFFRR